MRMNQARRALKMDVDLTSRTCLMVRSGAEGEFADSAVERDCTGERLHVNGYVWAGLARRCMARVDGAGSLAAMIGDYGKDASELGVSPLWCEASFAGLPSTDIRPGNRIDRKWKCADGGALFSDEIVPPGLDLKFRAVYFSGEDPSALEDAREKFLAAFRVMDEGVENIGGGWSYGFGRLNVGKIRMRTLDLSDPACRKELWRWDVGGWREERMPGDRTFPGIAPGFGWKKLRVRAAVADGQLLAVSQALPPLDMEGFPKEDMPDSFVFRSGRLVDGKPGPPEIVVPGKAFRQAVLSGELERKFRSRSLCERVCEDFGGKKQTCACRRCRWFGNTGRRGLVSVADASVENAETRTLHRVQLCEHSFQNMNLFAGEYLAGGEFEFEIVVDGAGGPDKEKDAEEVFREIQWLCGQMAPDGDAPPGWHRLGKTSAATGQLVVKKIDATGFGQ